MDSTWCHGHPTVWAKLEGQHAPRLPARSAHGSPRPRTCRHRQSRHCRLQAAVVPSPSSQHACPAEEAEHNQSQVPGPASERRGKLGLSHQRGVVAQADKASCLPAWHQACMLTSAPLQLQMALQIAFVISQCIGVPAQLQRCTSAWQLWSAVSFVQNHQLLQPALAHACADAATDAQQDLPSNARDLCPPMH